MLECTASLVSLEVMKSGETFKNMSENKISREWKTVLSWRDHWIWGLQVLGPGLAGVKLL